MYSTSHEDFQLTLFGIWQLKRCGAPVTVAPRQQRMIAALAILGPRPRSYLSGVLWPEKDECRAMESLRVALHLISQQTPGLLVCDGAVVGLQKTVAVDLYQMTETIEAFNSCRLVGAEDSLMTCLRHADLLPGWYDDWVVLEQSRLAFVRFRAYENIAYADYVNGNLDRATEAARAAVELEPLRERAVRMLIRIEVKAGNHAAALRAFDTFRERLSSELGIGPSDRMWTLIREFCPAFEP